MKRKLKYNYLLFIPLLILNIISLLNMINAKLISSSYNRAFFKQLIWFILGYLLIYIINKFNLTKKIFNNSKFFYLFNVFLLILVLILGINKHGAKCWLNIFGLSFQPSELMKISLIISLINVLNKTKIKTKKDKFILIFKYFILTFIPSLLVFLEPDTGAIINYLIIFIIVLFCSKLDKKWYIFIISLSFILFIILFISYFYNQDIFIKLLGTNMFYRMDRIVNFKNKVSYQLENSLISIGASSLLGKGLNKILIYIPEAPTDFIFTFNIGNFGILSGFITLICYYFINLVLFKIIKKIKHPNIIFSYCFMGMFLFHQIYNIFMNIGLVPIMGIPLPFLSYGGTSTIINYIFIGMILNMIK